jgi:DNA ligase-1
MYGVGPKPSFTDAPIGRGMRFATVAAVYERLEATTKRLEMTDILAELLKETPADIVDQVVYLTQGKIAPDFSGLDLGLAEKLAVKALAAASGEAQDRVEARWKEQGDLGKVAEALSASKRQRSLMPQELTVQRVHANLVDIATASGSGSQDLKIRKLQEMLIDAEPVEAKYILRTVIGKMRLGVADMTIVDALAQAFATKEERDEVERAYNVSSDMGRVAKAVASGGLKAAGKIGLTIGIPVRSMQCERLESIIAIIERLGECAFEYKYDGLRVQAHVDKKGVRLFSRQLEDITEQFPEIVTGMQKAFRGKSGIIEGEAVPVDANTGTFLPFQQVSHRRGRKYGVDAAAEEFPVTLFLFDCLLLEGKDLLASPWRDRRKALKKAVKPNDGIRLSDIVVTVDPEEAETFFERALEVGCEGLIAKVPDSKYEAGARGYQWIKYKREYRSELNDTVDLVVVGAFAGRGKRAGTYGALLCAAYDKDEDTFRTICKLGTGFDDATLFALPERLDRHKTEHRHARVDSEMEADAWFAPETVVEVLAAEITLSPIHTAGKGAVRPGSGLALRFPRFTGTWREDKKPEDATSVDELLNMYRQQEKRVGA